MFLCLLLCVCHSTWMKVRGCLLRLDSFHYVVFRNWTSLIEFDKSNFAYWITPFTLKLHFFWWTMLFGKLTYNPGSVAKITINLPKVMCLIHSTPSCSTTVHNSSSRVSDTVYWTPVGNFMHVKKTYVHTHTCTYMLINTHINKNKYFTLNTWNENTFVSCSPFLLSFQSLLYLLALFQTHGIFFFTCLSVWASVCS